MAKLTLTDLASLTSNEASAISTINANHALIETALENTLSRDGTSPNTMSADFDMNNNDILNAGNGEFATLTVGGETIEAGTVDELDELTDVTLTSPATGHVLRYNGTVWVNATPETVAGSIDLDDLTDVTITAAATGDLLRYNGTAWVDYPDSNYQAADATLTALAGLATAADKLPYATGSDTFSTTDLTSFARTILDDANAAAVRTTIGVDASGTAQPLDATLTALAGVTVAADQVIYATGADAFAATGLTAFGRSIIDDADEATFKATVNLEIGTDVQAYDADTLKADVSDNLTVGYTSTAYNAGTQSSGTYTPDPANGNFQRAVNGGAHTLAPPSVGSGDSTTVIIQYTNNASAGTITTSGFTIVSGDTLTTTDGDDFLMYTTVCNGFSHLNVVALQ